MPRLRVSLWPAPLLPAGSLRVEALEAAELGGAAQEVLALTEAITILKAEAAPPADAGATTPQREAANLIAKGLQLQRTGNLEGAYAAFSDAALKDPGNRDAVMQRDGARFTAFGPENGVTAVRPYPVLEDAYRRHLPVVEIDGVRAFKFYVDEDDLRDRLRRRGAG